jgi:serine/threonine protein kinase
MAGPHSRPSPDVPPPGAETALTRPALPTTLDAAADRAAPPEHPPDIPRYRVGRRIGHGGMGVVYEAVGPLGVAVALKVIHPDKLTPALRARFRQEARALMGLDHPHLARIYEFGEAPAGPYFTMRLLSGRTLGERYPDYRRDPVAGLRALLKAADAVAYLHARRLVHRDVKPSNILLDESGEPFVSDLGLVKELAGEDSAAAPPAEPSPTGGTSSTLTQTGAALGTRAYMAPEQLAGDHARVGPPADVYALGLIACEIAWGSRPAVGADGAPVLLAAGPGEPETRSAATDSDDLSTGPRAVAQFLASAAEPPPADPPTLPAAVGARLRPVVARSLAAVPAARYPTAAEFRDALAFAIDPAAAGPRPSRRWVLAAGAVGAVGVAAWAARVYLGPRPKEDAADGLPAELVAVRRELAETGAVELLDPDGRWRWSEWLGGDADWHPGPHPDGPADARGWFAPPPQQIRLLELARGLSRFRFVVEVAHVGTQGEVGAYVGRSVQMAEGRPHHCFVGALVRNPKPGDGGERSVRIRGCAAHDPDSFGDVNVETLTAAVPFRPWTVLGLSLTVSDLVVAVDGKVIVRKGRNSLMRDTGVFGQGARKNSGVTPTYHPTEGLGVYAFRDPIAVRSARLERVEP